MSALDCPKGHGPRPQRYSCGEWYCVECRRELRLAGQEPSEHGLNGYKTFGCRCPICSADHSADLAARRARRTPEQYARNLLRDRDRRRRLREAVA